MMDPLSIDLFYKQFNKIGTIYLNRSNNILSVYLSQGETPPPTPHPPPYSICLENHRLVKKLYYIVYYFSSNITSCCDLFLMYSICADHFFFCKV